MCHEWISGSMGLWLLVSAFTLATVDRSNLINCLLVGIVLIGVGSWAGINYGMWHDWIIAGLGIWMMISGTIMEDGNSTSRLPDGNLNSGKDDLSVLTRFLYSKEE